MRKLLSFLLVMVISMTAIFALVPPIEASAASGQDFTNNSTMIAKIDRALTFYKPGSYFSKNGNQCGSCHNKGICVNNASPCNCLRYLKIDGKTVDLRAVQCMGYAHYFQYMLFGDFGFTDASKQKFTKIAGSQSSLNANSAKEYFEKYKEIIHPGTHIRVRGDAHSLILLDIDYGKGTITYIDANYDLHCRVNNIQTYTWQDFASKHKSVTHMWVYTKYYTEFPNCACKSFTSLGVCTECGKTYDWQSTFSTADAGTYKVSKDFTPRTDAPYDAATKASTTLKKGTTVKVNGSYTNAFGNKWYKFTYDSGKVGYVLHSYLELVSYNTLNVTCAGFTPAENESLPLGKGYPVWGTVSSNYPLKKVVAKLDGKEYATWTASNDNTTSFAINPTDINNKLKFGSLSAGKHTVTLIATDVHGRTQTFLTRNFNMVSTSCSHSYSSTYSKDANNHWKVCSKCGSTASVEAHTYTNDCDTSCNTCGATRSVSHNYEYAWDQTSGGDFNPSPQHYKECTKCGDKKDYENHTWELMLATNGQYMTLQTLHIYECSVCGKSKNEYHIYDNACDMDCSVCGRNDRPNVTHSFGTSYSNNANGHWHNCSICGEKDSVESHAYSNNCDATCNTCGYIRSTTHTYSNDCDTTCNVCGATRSTTHIYSNGCDLTCNICGASRGATSHEYDNACDTSCNICGETRTTNHKYSNVCDTSCDVCGAVRSVPDHVFDHGCDTSCNNCGYSRPTNHRYDNNCDSSCNVCGATRTVSHTYSSSYSSDANNHWRVCSSCGYKGYVENHIPGSAATETSPQKCLACGYVINKALGHTHQIGSSYEKDSYQHWHECSDKNCGARLNVEDHVFDDGSVTKDPTTTEKGEMTYVCTICGVEKYEDIDVLPEDPIEPGNPVQPDNPIDPDDSVDIDDGENHEKENGGFDTTTVLIISVAVASVAILFTALVMKRRPSKDIVSSEKETKVEQRESNEDDQ